MEASSALRWVSHQARIALLFVATILCTLSTVQAATYYIDYNAPNDSANGTSKETPWKRCPGMVGFSGNYTHSPGDIFVFKGGVTWPQAALPLTISYSGEVGAEDQYTVDKSWYSGIAWDYPIFDGQNKSGGLNVVYSYKKSNIIIDGLKIINAGDLTTGYGTGISCNGGSNKIIRNCFLEPVSVNAYADVCIGGGSNSYFYGNTIKRAARVHVTCGDNTYDNYHFFNNIFYGAGQLFGSYHSDGFMIQSDGVGSYKFTNIKIHNNKFLGDWSVGATALFYTSCNTGAFGLQHTEIFNNQFVQENTSGGVAGAIRLGYCSNLDDVRIYNNTMDLSSVTTGNLQAVILVAANPSMNLNNLDIRNNIIMGAPTGILVTPNVNFTGSTIIEHNLYSFQTGSAWLINNNSSKTYCKTISGDLENYPCQPIHEAVSPEGQLADPLFVARPANSVVGSGDFHLQPGSPAIGAGANLGAFLTMDAEGKLRPSQGNWDVGAYVADRSSISPPQGFRIDN